MDLRKEALPKDILDILQAKFHVTLFPSSYVDLLFLQGTGTSSILLASACSALESSCLALSSISSSTVRPCLTREPDLLSYGLHMLTKMAIYTVFSRNFCSPSQSYLFNFCLTPLLYPKQLLCANRNWSPSILYLTRTWCYGLHRRRLQLLGQFKKL